MRADCKNWEKLRFLRARCDRYARNEGRLSKTAVENYHFDAFAAIFTHEIWADRSKLRKDDDFDAFAATFTHEMRVDPCV